MVRKLMAKKPADRFQSPDELMDALAPHAAPSVMDWPIAAPTSVAERASHEDIMLAEEVQVDTEPRSQSATRINDHESILDWADQTRRHRRFRRSIAALAAFLLGAVALGATAVIAWLLTQ